MKIHQQNKTIWMSWLQGEADKSMPKLNRECISRWKELNPTWQANVLSSEAIGDYVPEYFEIVKKSKFDRNFIAKSELLRLLLLNKYGGIWVDASVYPMLPLDDFISDILSNVGFFTYRFMNRSYRRETVSWFLVANCPNHYLIKTWLDAFIDDFLNCPLDWNTGKTEDEVINPSKYFEVHATLSSLYDSNEKIRNIIDNMVQINQAIPHSALDHWEKRENSYMYKRPNLKF